MGICYSDLRIYWRAKLRGASFKDTVTIGHQNVYLHPAEAKLLRRFYYKRYPDSKIDPLENCGQFGFADNLFFNLLGVQRLSNIDYSQFEGATIIHDMNTPIPRHLEAQFDVVIDGGSLEHIFNLPIAISNMMRMVKVGGKVFVTTPANNNCGHGFYQFSPELMFRVFTLENGFRLDGVLFYPSKTADYDSTSNLSIYEVIDPSIVRERVELISKTPVLMMAEATRIADVPIFASAPLQSDYAAMWNSSGPQQPSSLLRTTYNKMPSFIKSKIKSFYIHGRNSLSNSRFYHKLQY